MSEANVDRLILKAQIADRIADNCRPDNRHHVAFRKDAFEKRKKAREIIND